jgi:hypothetical protein
MAAATPTATGGGLLGLPDAGLWMDASERDIDALPVCAEFAPPADPTLATTSLPVPILPWVAPAMVASTAQTSGDSGANGWSGGAKPITSATVFAGSAISASGASLTSEATVPQPGGPNDVVGLVLQNWTNATLPATYITFGTVFGDGEVMPTVGLDALINGAPVPVQLDAKTFYADGSVRNAVVTLLQPQIAAGASDNVMLQRATARSTPSVDLAPLADGSGGWDATVVISGLTMTSNATVAPAANITLDVDSLLQSALANGTATTWLAGPNVSEVEFSQRIDNSPLRVTFDLRRYADGSVYCDVAFNADAAMDNALGTNLITLDYTASVSQTGSETAAGAATVLAPTAITQYQYQTWDQPIYSTGSAPPVNVQQDVAALERTGAVQNWDLSAGLLTHDVSIAIARLGTAQFSILQSGYYTQYMPETGGRADIGPQTKWNVEWLITQNAGAAQYALAQADAGGSIPWHLWDPTTGTYISAQTYANLWVTGDNLGNAIGLVQPMSSGSNAASGWTVDSAHEPDTAYIAYLLTGSQYYLAQLNAEAAYDIVNIPPTARTNGGASSNVANGPLRAVSWDLREVVEAAAANPAGSAEQQYFLGAAEDTIGYMLREAANANEGAVSGWFENPVGRAGIGQISPWWEDYLASTLGLACGLGIAGAKELLAWETNFLAGRFLNPNGSPGNTGPNGGLDPYSAIAYTLTTYASSPTASLFIGVPNATPVTSWAGVGSTQPVFQPGNLTLNASSDYQAQALAALAESITYTGSTQAIEAYGWLQAYATAANAALFQLDPTFDIVPRLSDGKLLTGQQVFIRNDAGASPVIVRDGGADQLIYEEGNAAVTIVGGAGINILFGGGGATTLVGGPGNDYLFGGEGATTFESGSGNDYIQVQATTVNNTDTWTPAPGATIVLSVGDTGDDTIVGFRPGTDHLSISGASLQQLASLVAGATRTQGGSSTVLHLSAAHVVTLQGITAASLSLFA